MLTEKSCRLYAKEMCARDGFIDPAFTKKTAHGYEFAGIVADCVREYQRSCLLKFLEPYENKHYDILTSRIGSTAVHIVISSKFKGEGIKNDKRDEFLQNQIKEWINRSRKEELTHFAASGKTADKDFFFINDRTCKNRYIALNYKEKKDAKEMTQKEIHESIRTLVDDIKKFMRKSKCLTEEELRAQIFGRETEEKNEMNGAAFNCRTTIGTNLGSYGRVRNEKILCIGRFRTCGFSKRAKQLLEGRGFTPTYIEADEENTLGSKMRLTGLTVPQIWIDGSYIGGFNELQSYLQSRV